MKATPRFSAAKVWLLGSFISYCVQSYFVERVAAPSWPGYQWHPSNVPQKTLPQSKNQLPWKSKCIFYDAHHKLSWNKRKFFLKINAIFHSFPFSVCMQAWTSMFVLRVWVRKLINKELPLPSWHPGEIRGCWSPPSTCPLPPVPPIAEELLWGWREQLR